MTLNILFKYLGLFMILSACSNYQSTTNNISIEKYEPKKIVPSIFGEKVILVGGCFDILHYGHIEFLKKAKQEGTFLIVALEPDERISHCKKRTPTHNMMQRASNLSAVRYVDKVLLLPTLKGFEDYNQLVEDIKPHVIAVTSDDPFIENKKMQARSVGGELKVVINRISNFSSSRICGSGKQ